MNSSFSASGRTFVSLFCNFKVHRLILSAVHAILNVESNPSLKGNLFNSPSISRIVRTSYVVLLRNMDNFVIKQRNLGFCVNKVVFQSLPSPFCNQVVHP